MSDLIWSKSKLPECQSLEACGYCIPLGEGVKLLPHYIKMQYLMEKLKLIINVLYYTS